MDHLRTHGTPRNEQRRYPRHSVTTAATVFRDTEVSGLFWVKNLSIGGALLCGGEAPPVGDPLSMVLHLPWRQPVTVDARVVHRQTGAAGDPLFGVAFRHRTSGTRRAVAEAIRSVEQIKSWPRKPTVMVIADQSALLGEIKRDLSPLGVRIMSVKTPLDAIRLLQDWETRIDIVLVDLWIEQTNVLSLLRFLADEHPEIRRIIITDNPAGRLAKVAIAYGKVNGVLRQPWSKTSLVTALDLDEHPAEGDVVAPS
jgi:CheY-like chemotaxis protein